MRWCEADADVPVDTSETSCVFEVGVGGWPEQRASSMGEQPRLDAHPGLWTLDAQAV